MEELRTGNLLTWMTGEYGYHSPCEEHRRENTIFYSRNDTLRDHLISQLPIEQNDGCLSPPSLLYLKIPK